MNNILAIDPGFRNIGYAHTQRYGSIGLTVAYTSTGAPIKSGILSAKGITTMDIVISLKQQVKVMLPTDKVWDMLIIEKNEGGLKSSLFIATGVLIGMLDFKKIKFITVQALKEKVTGNPRATKVELERSLLRANDIRCNNDHMNDAIAMLLYFGESN